MQRIETSADRPRMNPHPGNVHLYPEDYAPFTVVVKQGLRERCECTAARSNAVGTGIEHQLRSLANAFEF